MGCFSKANSLGLDLQHMRQGRSQKYNGRPALDPRIVLGSIIIKHLCDSDDRETVSQISENNYMQYFLDFFIFIGSLFFQIDNRFY